MGGSLFSRLAWRRKRLALSGQRAALRAALAVIAALSLALGTSLARAAEIGQQQLRGAMQATVYLKLQRLFRNQPFPTSGSGFFIDARGYLITNWHVVAPQIELVIEGEMREVTTTTGTVDVVIGSGTPGEKTVVAQVVSLDRKRDLALVKVPTTAPAWLPVGQQATLEITNQIWAIGYPFGEMLALNKKNPEVTVTAGRVTSVRHGEKGDVEAVQVDAAINPGNSGGPVLNERGEAIGVVYASLIGGNSTSLVIPPERLAAFLADQQVRVKVEPPGVFNRRIPIKVRISPLLLELKGTRCDLTLTGDNIETVHQELSWTGSELAGLLVVPRAQEGKKKPATYLLELRIRTESGKQVLERRYSLPVREEAAAKVASDRNPADMMRDRLELGNRAETSHLERSLPGDEGGEQPGGQATALGELGKSVKLKGQGGDGAVTISNSNMFGIAFAGKPESYQHLPSQEARDLALEYDRHEYTINFIKEALRDVRVFEGLDGKTYTRERVDAPTLQGALVSLRARIQVAASKLATAGLCRCPDGVWQGPTGKLLCEPCRTPSPVGL